MKKLICHKCSCYLGDLEKGKIKKDAVILCAECMDKYKLLDDLEKYNKNMDGKSDSYDMPDFIKNLMNNKGTK